MKRKSKRNKRKEISKRKVLKPKTREVRNDQEGSKDIYNINQGVVFI